MNQMGDSRWHKPVMMFCCSALLVFAALCFGCSSENKGTEDESELPDETVGTDTSSDTTPACLSDIDTSVADEDADALFYYDHVPTVDIYLPEAAWEELLRTAVDEQYTEAEVCFEGRGIGTVGLRFKGSYGSLSTCFDGEELICPRLSIKLKFNKYDEEKRFFGLKRLNFNANRWDDSRMRERLAYDLFRSMGIIAPRAAWAVVRVNGASLGLYGMVEQEDGRFTDDRWPDYPDGNLYKEVWPTDNNIVHITRALRTNEDEGDISGFQAFADAMVAADESNVRQILGEHTDLTHWLRFLAVDDALANGDGITFFWYVDGNTGSHNYYFYEDAPQHFTLVPWDVEATFWIDPDHVTPHWTEVPEDCGIAYPDGDSYALAPACDPVFSALGEDVTAWRDAARELLIGPFAEETMIEAIERHAAFIGEEARTPETPTVFGSFDDAVEELKASIPELRDRLEALIAEAN